MALAVSAAGAAAVAPFDGRVAVWSQRPALQQQRALRRGAAALRWLGQPGALGLSAMTYGVGLSTRDRATATVGLRLTGSVLAAAGITTGVKLVVGRARPAAVGDSLPYSFAFGRGARRGGEYRSMPSGHAAMSFAAAAALASEGARRWPAANRAVAPAAYTTAALVGLSRIYHDRHWASDVVAGAGVGTFAGVVLTRYLRERPDSHVGRRLLPSSRSRAPNLSSRRGRRFPLTFAYSVRF